MRSVILSIPLHAGLHYLQGCHGYAASGLSHEPQAGIVDLVLDLDGLDRPGFANRYFGRLRVEQSSFHSQQLQYRSSRDVWKF